VHQRTSSMGSRSRLSRGFDLVGRPVCVIGWCGPMSIDEIVLPITEPETEWVRGRALQKMSPQRDHARVQMKLAGALDGWARGRGEVGTEWRFRIALAGEPRRPLVPDIAFVASERLRALPTTTFKFRHSRQPSQSKSCRPTTIPATWRVRSSFICAQAVRSSSSSIRKRGP